METQKRRRDQVESDTLTHLRRGTLDILDAVAVQLPDVFYGEILPKLSLRDTFNLAKVNRAYRDAVWSAEGVRSLGTKINDHVDKTSGYIIVHDPMYYMTLHGSSRAVRALLQSGVDVNKVYGADKTTALHEAAINDHALVALDLIDAGADLNAKKVCGETPLYKAVQYGNTSVVMALTKSGADVNPTLADSSDTLLDMAIAERYDTIAALLISHGADIRKINTALRDEAKHLDMEEDKGLGKLIRVAERLAPSE